jgi:signal transduction histidine kinase
MIRRVFGFLGVEMLAVAAGLGLTLLLLSPSTSDVIELGAYLAVSALVSILVIEILVRSGLLSSRARLKLRITMAAGIGAGLGFINAFAMSALMFVNTGHDLPLLLAILVFAAVIAGYAAVRMSSSVSSSMTALAASARLLTTGDLTARMASVHGDSDLEEVVTAFNEMATSLEDAAKKKDQVEQSRRELSAAISHDLRTPLSSARAMLEAIRDGVVHGDEERDEYVERTLTQIKSLGSMVDDLFAMSLLDAGELRLELHQTMLNDLVDDTLRSMQPAAEQKGLTLAGQVDHTLGKAVMDSRQVSRVLLNLVQNAIRHTPPDGTVTVAVKRHDHKIEFEVTDTGEGFDPDDSSKIWTRFFRSDPARSRVADESAQIGLGLAISKGIVELHGGAISAKSPADEGATFRFWIPDQVLGAAT